MLQRSKASKGRFLAGNVDSMFDQSPNVTAKAMSRTEVLGVPLDVSHAVRHSPTRIGVGVRVSGGSQITNS